MDAHCEMILEQFDEDKESFAIIKDVCMRELKRIIKDRGMLVNSVEARIKTRKSLTGKLELKGYKYRTLADITDIVGARVVTFYEDEVDIVAGDVEQAFDIDWDNSVDKRKMLEADRFGYMSLHYICRIPKSLYEDPEHPEVNEYRFEIQMRTTLQHVWATIFHDTGYKSDVEVPKSYIRNLSRLAGLLEIADSEFKGIRDGIDSYRDNMRMLMSEGRFDEIELTGDSWKDYLKLDPFAELKARIAAINGAEVAKTSGEGYLHILKAMEFETIGDIERMKAECSDDAFAYAESGLAGTDLDIVSASVALQNLIIVKICKMGFGVVGLTAFYDKLYGKRPRNAKMAQRAYDKVKALGII